VNKLTVLSVQSPTLWVVRDGDDGGDLALVWSVESLSQEELRGRPAQPVEQVLRFQVELSLRESFNNVLRTSVTSNNYLSLAGLTKNTYFARVRSVGGASSEGNIVAPGSWSDVVAVEVFGGFFQFRTATDLSKK
jgi:hypothetical protein